MRLERVEIQGFRSFKDLEVFDLSPSPGLVYLTGRNEDQPALGRNGAGKSSMWDAVYWCLYGVASTGLQGPEVATWESGSGIYVHVCLKGHAITRTWKPNTLKLDGNEATQEQVVEAVGLSREQFLFCAYIAQGTDSFLDLQATAKTDLLASVLGLDRWLTFSAKADDIARGHAEELAGIEADIVRATAAADELRTTDYTEASSKWRARRQEELDRVAALRQEEEDAADNSRALLKTSKSAHAEAAAQVESQRERRERADKALRDADKALASTSSWVRKLKERTGSCPTCSRPWPHSHDSDKQLATLEADQDEQAGIAERAGRVFSDATAKLRNLEQELARCAEAVDKHQRACERAEQTMQELARRAQAARSERDPFVAMSLERDERLERLTAKCARLQAAATAERTSHEAALFWVKGYKDVRLFLVAEALAQLEVETNSELVQLGLHGWEVRFAPDSETKSGAVKRGFSVSILSPSNTRPVPWKVWSGGEAQRLRQATTMGLSNLISAYTGYQAFVEVWDEPSDGMSPEGIKDMLATLARRAAVNNRQVWVVDHNALESGAFVETVTAVKQDGTTKLERQNHGQGE